MKIEWMEYQPGTIWTGIAEVDNQRYVMQIRREEDGRYCLEACGGFFDVSGAFFYAYNKESLCAAAIRLVELVKLHGNANPKFLPR